jgi:hypothetical protein
MSITAGSGVEVVAIDTPALGDRSYLAHDGSAALVIDPQRDIDRVLALAATHMSYVLLAAGHPHAVFSGGSLLYGSTGRPDLLGTAHAGELARAQYASAGRLAAELPADADVYPTHGFGSFCSATQAEGTSSTIGAERAVNPVLTLDEDMYVAQTLASLDAYPAYYAHMGPANAAGPAGPDLTPRRPRRPGRLGSGTAAARLPSRGLRRPGGSTPPPPGRHRRRAPQLRMGCLAHRRGRAHPAA